jgi:hypothetical protein
VHTGPWWENLEELAWNTCSYLGEFLNRLEELGLVSSWSGWEQMAGSCESRYLPVPLDVLNFLNGRGYVIG